MAVPGLGMYEAIRLPVIVSSLLFLRQVFQSFQLKTSSFVYLGP